MDLRGYQAKQLFVRYGLPAPVDYAYTTPHEAEEAASKIGADPWIVECQIHAGGCDKAGGVKVVDSGEDARTFAENRLGECLVMYQIDANGQLANQTLAEAVTDIAKELYLGAVVDRSSRRVVSMASTEGGAEIERVTEETPHLVHKATLDPLTGPMLYQGCELALKLGLEDKLVQQPTRILMGLAIIFLERDLALIEINPLVITKQGDLICLDDKLSTDDNILFRQLDLHETCDQSQGDPRETRAAQWELNYVALGGDIGCMVNGAGLAMGTMDIVKLHGGEPANFLNVSGGAAKERVTKMFKIILSDDKVRVVLVSIFGGIVHCGLIVDGIIGTVAEVGVNVPVVVRLEGSNAELGAKKLAGSGLNIIAAKGLTDTV